MYYETDLRETFDITAVKSIILKASISPDFQVQKIIITVHMDSQKVISCLPKSHFVEVIRCAAGQSWCEIDKEALIMK